MHYDDAQSLSESGSEGNLYGSPTLPDLVTAPASAAGMASFIQSFPTDWLSTSEGRQRLADDSRTPTPTRGAHYIPPVPAQTAPLHDAADTRDATLSVHTSPVRESGSSLAVLLAPPPPRAGFTRSKSAQAIPLSLAPPPRPTLSHTSSLYNMRNVPMSAPAHKTSFTTHQQSTSLSGRSAWTAGGHDASVRSWAAGQSAYGVEFRTDIFAAAEDDDKPAPPPPFFYSRATPGSTASFQHEFKDPMYPPPMTRFYSHSDRSSTADVSDTMSTTSTGKKSKFKIAISKSIPRAISKHLLRRPSSSDLSESLIADESFGCIGVDSDSEDVDVVSRQNAPLKTVPDSFKRLFTPPNSAPPVPPLPAAHRREPGPNADALSRSRDFQSDSSIDVKVQVPRFAHPEPLLPAAILREQAPLGVHPLLQEESQLPKNREPVPAPLQRVPTVVDFETSSTDPSLASPAPSLEWTSIYGSSSGSCSTPSLLRTPEEVQGSEVGCASVLVSGEETPVRRKRDGMVNGPVPSDLHGLYGSHLTFEPDSYAAPAGEAKAPPMLFMQQPTPPRRTSSKSSIASTSTSDGSDLGLDGLMWPKPPGRTVTIDAVSRQSWQEVVPTTEYFDPGSPPSLDARHANFQFRVDSQPTSADQSPDSPATAVGSPTAQPLSPRQLLTLVHTIFPESVVPPPRTPPSPCPSFTVTMPSERFVATRSVPSSPGMLSPRPHPFKPRRPVPSPGDAWTQTYKTDSDTMLPAKLIVNREEKVAIDAPKWSELVAYCRANEDTIIRETMPTTPRVFAEQSSSQRLQVCVWEVGEYNHDVDGLADINDPKHFRVTMTLTVRPENPRIDTRLAMHRARSVSPTSVDPSPNSVYSCSSPARSAESLHSPSSFSTPPLSLNASTPPSSFSGSSAAPSALFSGNSSANHSSFTDASVPDSSIPGSAFVVAKNKLYTPLTSPNGSMMGLANLGFEGSLKKLVVVPPSPDVQAPSSPSSAEGAPRGRSRVRRAAYESVEEPAPPLRPDTPGEIKRELILHFSVPMPTVLGQIVNMASQYSYGEGVNVTKF